jgi:hypothetical protein
MKCQFTHRRKSCKKEAEWIAESILGDIPYCENHYLKRRGSIVIKRFKRVEKILQAKEMIK